MGSLGSNLGWHYCHCHSLSSLVWGEVEQGGGRHRSSLQWQPLKTPDRTVLSTRETSQDGRELSAGTWVPGRAWGWRLGLLTPDRDWSS